MDLFICFALKKKIGLFALRESMDKTGAVVGRGQTCFYKLIQPFYRVIFKEERVHP